MPAIRPDRDDDDDDVLELDQTHIKDRRIKTHT